MHPVKHLFLAIVLLVSSTKILYANHTGEGTVAGLSRATQQLVQIVNYSPLKYEVKSAVYRFSYDVQYLAQCVGGCRLDGDTTDNHSVGGVPAACYRYFQRAQASWRPVNYYLYDTYYDLPQVYRAYVEVREELEALGG